MTLDVRKSLHAWVEDNIRKGHEIFEEYEEHAEREGLSSITASLE